MIRLLGILVAFLIVARATPAHAQACNKKLDSWEVKDPRATSTTKVELWACDKLGSGKPGVQVKYVVGTLVQYCAVEPDHANKTACSGKPVPGQTEWLIADRSDTFAGAERFVKNSLVYKDGGWKLRVEVKVKNNAKAQSKEYKLPFELDCTPEPKPAAP